MHPAHGSTHASDARRAPRCWTGGDGLRSARCRVCARATRPRSLRAPAHSGAAVSAFGCSSCPPASPRRSLRPRGSTRRQRVDLILYALPNGNSTAQTMGRAPAMALAGDYDIQHIGAQTRALRARGLPQAVVVYLEADSKSWPSWRASSDTNVPTRASSTIVDQLRAAIGNPRRSLAVTLTGHSGGGSFMFGFIEGQDALPDWLERIAFLDANYNFDPAHGDKLVASGCAAIRATRWSCLPTTTARSCSTARRWSPTPAAPGALRQRMIELPRAIVRVHRGHAGRRSCDITRRRSRSCCTRIPRTASCTPR